MLDSFDWLRHSRTGAELLATLEFIAGTPEVTAVTPEIGPPLSALNIPCRRCWLYARADDKTPYCAICRTIKARSRRYSRQTRKIVLMWGYVNQLPRSLQGGSSFDPQKAGGAYVHDAHHFLIALPKWDLKDWLQEVALYHGASMKGFLQLFPTAGVRPGLDMSGIFCRIVHRESAFPLDALRVRFYPAPYQVAKPYIREQEGLLTFHFSDFLGLLEMAAVFRTVLRPIEQEVLYKLLTTEDAAEEQFYWGRFLGILNQEAKDMLHAWRVRRWSRQRVKLLYELVNYVYVDFSQGR